MPQQKQQLFQKNVMGKKKNLLRVSLAPLSIEKALSGVLNVKTQKKPRISKKSVHK
jgi:hypothetical protein